MNRSANLIKAGIELRNKSLVLPRGVAIIIRRCFGVNRGKHGNLKCRGLVKLIESGQHSTLSDPSTEDRCHDLHSYTLSYSELDNNAGRTIVSSIDPQYIQHQPVYSVFRENVHASTKGFHVILSFDLENL